MDRLSQNPTIAPATSEIPLRKFDPTSSIRPFSLWIYGKLLRTFPQPPQARRRLTTFDQDLTPSRPINTCLISKLEILPRRSRRLTQNFSQSESALSASSAGKNG